MWPTHKGGHSIRRVELPFSTVDHLRRRCSAGLWVDAPYLHGLGHSGDRQYLRRDSHAHILPLSGLLDVVEGADQDPLEAFVDLGLGPKVPLQALHPLKVGNRDAPGGSVDVGNNKFAFALQDAVSLRRGWAISAFSDHFGPDLSGILLVDLVLQCSGH